MHHYSQLIGKIYDAAQEPTHWVELLAELEEICGGLTGDMQHGEEVLEPHFLRALKINQQTRQLKQENRTSAAILNRLPIGILVVNRNAVPVSLNARAKTLLNHQTVLRIHLGSLVCDSTQQTKQLHQLIQQCISNPQEYQGEPLQVCDSRGQATSLWITPSNSQCNKEDEDEYAVIYLSSPLIRPECNARALRETYDLSEAETRLIKTLVNGCNNLNEAAELLGLSIHTVRTQMKKVFEKTDTSSQLEIVKKVLRSPEMIVGESLQLESVADFLNAEWPGDTSGKKAALFDGRKLAYSEYGDAEGYPVLYFHSNTGGELECDHGNDVLLQHGIRLISVSRPGFGESDRSPQYSLLNHAEDIKQLLDQLGIQSCAILSLSSGAAHALACCHHMPERVRHVCMIGPTGLQISKDDIALYTGSFGARIFAKLTMSMPKVMLQVIEIGHNMFSHDIESFWQKVDTYLCDNDRLEISKHRESMIRAFLQANQRGNKQTAKEIALLIQPWGFEPANIQTPVTVWHGQHDLFTPIAVCRNMVARLQNVELHEIEHEGFYMTFKQWPNIIENLAKQLQLE